MIFGRNYADLYDLLYTDKPYEQEVETIDALISKYLADPAAVEILDAGCGTGNHSVFLSNNSRYSVVGLDRSAGMLDNAKKKIPGMRFVEGDIADFDLHETFDVMLTMAAVLGYQNSNEGIMNAFRCARKHVRPGGLYLFDVWYGPTVLQTGVGERIKRIEGDGVKFLRLSKGTLHQNENVCHVRYQIWDNHGNEFVEDHYMRFFFPMEITHMLKLSGFHVLKIGQCPNIFEEPDFDSWHMMIAARAA